MKISVYRKKLPPQRDKTAGAASSQRAVRKPLAACTIIARNYLSHARILAESYSRQHPGARFYLFVVDNLPDGTTIDNVETIRPEALGLPYYYEMCFKYNVTELSTAVKPTLLLHIMDRYQEDAVIYFDPDILVMRRLDELNDALAAGDIVLTPHLLKPIPRDGKRASEEDILIAGAYNLGFVAVKKSEETRAFLCWWEERLRDACRVDPGSGLMVDQRWVDLVPSLFPSTFILRDDTYNIAYWNLHSSSIEKRDDAFLVNGRPLAFFHFSGFNPTRPRDLSKHQNRHQIQEGTALAELIDLYIDLHMRAGYPITSRWPYGYSKFDNGAAINAQFRELYLGCDDDLRERFGDPFRVNGASSFYRWATAPDDTGLSPFLNGIYRSRYDVAAVFPDVRGKDREGFLHWARTQGPKEMGYDPEAVAVIAQAAADVETKGNGGDPSLSGAPGFDENAHHGPDGASEAASHQQERADVAPNDLAREASGQLGVNVSGYLRNESGLGAAARGYVDALRFLGVPIVLNDVSDLSVNRSEDRSLDGFTTEHPHDINLICVNADQHFVIMSHLGDEYFQGRYNIGIWAWELPTFPMKWYDRFEHYDEIWVGSSFIVNTLAPIAPIPVVRVPPVMTRREMGSRERGRNHLRVSDHELLYLFIFDFHSYFERKNPLAVIDAFKMAFPKSDPVRLVIKCVNEDKNPEALAMMQSRAVGYPISIYGGYWSSGEVQDLMAACDAYVSLHRAEGTGLTISDAMTLGKTVIATGWSGNMDFMSVSNSFPVGYRLVELEDDVGPYEKGAVWADPSVEHAAELMRFAFDNREEAQARGEVAKRDIEAHLSCERVARLVQDRLAVIKAHCETTRSTSGIPVPELASHQVVYLHLIARIRTIVGQVVPAGATVLVVSKGDEALLALDGRTGWHFPRALDGTYPGYYPADGAAAIAHLESLRTNGAAYFLLPSTAFWWLGSYGEFASHLDTRYRRVWSDEACILYSLTPSEAVLKTEAAGDLTSRVQQAEAQLQQLRDTTGALETQVAAREAWHEQAEALIAEVAERTEVRITELADESAARAERAEARLQELRDAAQSLETQLKTREAWAAQAEARLAKLAEGAARAERAEAGLQQLRDAAQALETRVAAREAWGEEAEARFAERQGMGAQINALAERVTRVGDGLQQLRDVAQALETRVAAREEWAVQAEARIAELASASQSDRGHVEEVASDVIRIHHWLVARPYMAKDPFGASGDPKQPMGYALDAANLTNDYNTRDLEFSDLFRGSEEFIMERQRAYLPFFENCIDVVDLGCGRGEFLRLLSEIGIRGAGVELDASLVERGRAKGLEVVEADALEYLHDLGESSLDGIFSAQVVEHLTTSQLTELLDLAKSRLREGGLFIAETVNPESFEALKVFHVDPSHHQPIFPQVLLYLCRKAGFRSARVFYPQGGGLTQEHYETAGEYAVIAVA